MSLKFIGENAWTSLIIHNSRNSRKRQNLNKRALTIREERAQIGQVAFIKIVLPLCRCQNPTTYARLFEEE